jgi:hypothetical protein
MLLHAYLATDLSTGGNEKLTALSSIRMSASKCVAPTRHCFSLRGAVAGASAAGVAASGARRAASNAALRASSPISTRLSTPSGSSFIYKHESIRFISDSQTCSVNTLKDQCHYLFGEAEWFRTVDSEGKANGFALFGLILVLKSPWLFVNFKIDEYLYTASKFPFANLSC